MDGTKDTRHGIEDTDPHMGMVEREKDAEHRTQRMQDTGDTQGMYTHAYRNKEDAKQRLQKRCSIVRRVKKRDRKAQGHCKRKKWTNVQKLNFETNRKPSNLSLS